MFPSQLLPCGVSNCLRILYTALAVTASATTPVMRGRRSTVDVILGTRPHIVRQPPALQHAVPAPPPKVGPGQPVAILRTWLFLHHQPWSNPSSLHTEADPRGSPHLPARVQTWALLTWLCLCAVARTSTVSTRSHRLWPRRQQHGASRWQGWRCLTCMLCFTPS